MEYRKYLGKYASSEDVQSAINDGELQKPYVALVGNSIDYNTLNVATGYVGMPLTFEITSDGDIVWKAANTANTITIEYKKNDGAWTEITSSTGGTSISVVSGDTVQFRGDNATYTTTPDYNQFYNSFNGTTSGFIVYGNIMSMINSTNFANITTLESAWTFSYLFSDCTGLTDASNLILPATTLTDSCYAYMFQGCSNLTTAPVLPALTLVSGCYDGMFHYCSSLNYIKCLATTDITQGYYTTSWVEGVPNSGGGGSSDSSSSSSSSGSGGDEPVPFEGGTFVKHPDNESWGFGYSDIPEGWTVEDAVL